MHVFGSLFLSDAISLNTTWWEAGFQKLIHTKEEMREQHNALMIHTKEEMREGRAAGEIKQSFHLNVSGCKSR